MKYRTLPTLAAAAVFAATPALSQDDAKEASDTQEAMFEAPADVAAVPADAEKSESGLAWKVLKAGEGEAKPAATDTVKVHYTGWTTDGKMFDSSHKRNQPAEFPLNGVIAGWTEGVQLMTEGEKRRFWIPADLAYGENPGGGRPGGLLVFDIELLEIQKAPELPADLEKTAAGTPFKVLTEGEGGETPTEADIVTFHLLAKTMDGQVMQDSTQQPQPPSLPLARLNPEMQELFKLMVPGEKRRAWLPGQGLPGGYAVVDLELISVKAAPPAPATPEDVPAVPDDAEKTASGLAFKVLEKGEGETKPKATDKVRVHYTGWTTDGELFDSSVTRGQPAEFPLNGVIAGWTEGVQLMTQGEKRRFWIPADLAYGENPGGGRPGGMLVFDIELLEILP